MIQSSLLPHRAGYIQGRWTASASGATLPVINPASGECLAEVPDMGATETADAIVASERALAHVSSCEERQSWLRAIYDALLEHRDEFAAIITQEQGKPLGEARVEVEYAAGFFRFFADQMAHLAPHTLDELIRNARWTIHHRPAGVAGLITPWNFPLAMLAKKLAPALAAGCSVVAKPAELTPLSAIALWTLSEKIGIPDGKMNLVIGQPVPIGDTLCAHPAVRVLSFTGSTEVGKLLIRNTAPYVKRLALELGGNAPFIVFEDADISAAAAAVIPNKFRCAGQTCVCANRFYVHRAVADEFIERLTEHVSKLRMGNGLEAGTDIGPLINRKAFDKVARHVADALAHGATRVFGDDPRPSAQDWGHFYPPSVLRDVTAKMLLTKEETFGPVVAVGTFEGEDEAVHLANSTPYGLAAYLFTQDQERAERIVRRLQFGHVGVNTGTGPTPEAPFGGMKQSGYGREGGEEGLWEFCETQTVASA